MYPSTELTGKKPVIKKKSKELYPFSFVRRKLLMYVEANNTAKDLRLLECHAHCFISLS